MMLHDALGITAETEWCLYIGAVFFGVWLGARPR